jgi:quinolinate synthase
MSCAATLARTAPLYDRVKSVIPPVEWPVFADDIDAILALKRRRNAVILAHNYQTPEIYHCVADIVGDSLALAREAMKVDAEVIVLAGVHFMAETAKLLNPAKTVLIPDTRADHRGRCAPAARALARRACGDLCQYIGGGEGGVRHLLHLRQRAQDHRIARRGAGDHAA